jgi:hypothetical protein
MAAVHTLLGAPSDLGAAAIPRADSDAGSDAGLPSLKSDSADEDDMDDGFSFDGDDSEASIPSLAADDAASDSEAPGLTDDEDDDDERSALYDSEMPGLKEHTEDESEDGGECTSAAGGLEAGGCGIAGSWCCWQENASARCSEAT